MLVSINLAKNTSK